MKSLLLFLGVIALGLMLTGFKPESNSAIEGEWIGEFTGIDHSVPFKVHFWRHDGALKGTITLSDGKPAEMPLSWVVVESTSVHFELVEPTRTLAFDGILRNGLITWELRYSNLRGTFQLAPQNLISS